MENKHKITSSLYRQIAIDIAKAIATGKYAQGEKLFGRSMLASHYKVSPETIRKSMFLLKDVGIVEIEKGSGIEVVSPEKAEEFVKRYDNIDNLSTVKNEIENWAKSQAEQATDILRKIQFVIDETERLNTANPFNPFQVKITSKCKVIGKTVNELCFWHNTGGTIVAIKRGKRLILSPGPYATFYVNDLVYIVGDDVAYATTMKLLFE